MPDTVDRLLREAREIERRNNPPGIFWPERHAEICKAAERVTRQQRRLAERQAAKKR